MYGDNYLLELCMSIRFAAGNIDDRCYDSESD
jgi:hypothetical protein